MQLLQVARAHEKAHPAGPGQLSRAGPQVRHEEAMHALRALAAPPVSNIGDDVALLSSPAWSSPLIDWAVAHSIERGVRASFSLPEQTQQHNFTMEDFCILKQGLALHWSKKGAAQLELIKHQLGLP